MIYLILKIFLYLLVALLLGLGAGWLIRNVVSIRREDELQKTITEVRARVPQFESLMRTRDQQVQRMRDELKDKNQDLKELADQIQGKEAELATRQREIGKLSARNQALETGGGETDDYASAKGSEAEGSENRNSTDVERLEEELTQLRSELGEARTAAADAVAEAACAETELVRLKSTADAALAASPDPASESADNNESLAREVADLNTQLRKKDAQTEQLNSELQREQRKVVELERERELQNRSLQVLHQQLEIGRERDEQTASG